MLERTPEPELMDEPLQARAYSEADFSVPHDHLIELLRGRLPGLPGQGRALDLGCGPGDVSLRFARAFPGWHIDGLDGAPNMIALARQRAAREEGGSRVSFFEARLPEGGTGRRDYALVLSNSLLHHLPDPAILWSSISSYRAGGPSVFVMDLSRPESEEILEAMVATYASGEPEILQRDFRYSLHAAYRPDEVALQLEKNGLPDLSIELVSDRHWIAWGRLGLERPAHETEGQIR